jgi:hypothetical protein
VPFKVADVSVTDDGVESVKVGMVDVVVVKLSECTLEPDDPVEYCVYFPDWFSPNALNQYWVLGLRPVTAAEKVCVLPVALLELPEVFALAVRTVEPETEHTPAKLDALLLNVNGFALAELAT